MFRLTYYNDGETFQKVIERFSSLSEKIYLSLENITKLSKKNSSGAEGLLNLVSEFKINEQVS
ncbi:hypothetical protein [Clostridium sp. DJ247]|uniref:hypothetical protein n=1 Tax=Clostridium sp. DJ247 TaxID=2726188 RepID=UPI001624E889|nr:hypothetical protein [Clostridium sp. DJ247]MBC2582430.1 hypothetical protein [Clostridium sp. DJ247]